MKYNLKQRVLAMCMAMLMVFGLFAGFPAAAEDSGIETITFSGFKTDDSTPAQRVRLISSKAYSTSVYKDWQDYKADTEIDAESGIWRGETLVTGGSLYWAGGTDFRVTFGATANDASTHATAGEVITIKGVFTYTLGSTSYSFRVEETKFRYDGSAWAFVEEEEEETIETVAVKEIATKGTPTTRVYFVSASTYSERDYKSWVDYKADTTKDAESGVWRGETLVEGGSLYWAGTTDFRVKFGAEENDASTHVAAGEVITIKGVFTYTDTATSTSYSFRMEETKFRFNGTNWEVVEAEIEQIDHDVAVKAIAAGNTPTTRVYFTSVDTYREDKETVSGSEVLKNTWKDYKADVEKEADSGIWRGETLVADGSLYWTGTSNFVIKFGATADTPATEGETVTIKGTFTYVYTSAATAVSTSYSFRVEETKFRFDGSNWEVVEAGEEQIVNDVTVKAIVAGNTPTTRVYFTSVDTYKEDKETVSGSEVLKNTWKDYKADVEKEADSGIWRGETLVEDGSLYWTGTSNFVIKFGATADTPATEGETVTIKGTFTYVYTSAATAVSTSYSFRVEETKFRFDGSTWAVITSTGGNEGGGNEGGSDETPTTIHPVEFTKTVSTSDSFASNPAKFVYIQSDTSYAGDVLPHDKWQAYAPDTAADPESGIWRGETKITNDAYIEKVSVIRYRLRFGATDETLAQKGDVVTVKGVFTYTDPATSQKYSFRVEETKFIYTGTNWKVDINTDYRDITLTKLDPTVAPKVSSSGNWGFYLIPSTSVTDFAKPWVDQFNDVVIQVGDTTVTKWLKVAFEENGLYFSIPVDILPEVIEKNTKIIIKAGEYDMSTDNTKGIRITKDCVIYANKYGFSMTGFMEEIKPSQTNVVLTLDTNTAYGGTAKGLYLNTTDNFPVDTTWATHIYAVAYDNNSGIFYNGEKLSDASIRRFADGKIYLSLGHAGVVAKDKDKVTIKGLFVQGTHGVSYKEVSFYYNGKRWGTTYTPAPPETYTKIKGVSINPASKYNETRGWDAYINVNTMLPGEIDKIQFRNLTIEVNGHVYEKNVSHAHEDTLFVCIHPEYLPQNAPDGTKITIKAGRALADDQTTGIELIEDFVFYVYKGGLTELEPTTNTKWQEIAISNLYRTRSYIETSKLWGFHLKTKQTLDLEQSTKLYDLQAEINGKMQKIEASVDGGMLYIKIRENILPGTTKTATIKIKAGAIAIGNAGRNGLRFTEDWTGYIYNGVISETKFDEVIRTEADIMGIQYVAQSATSYGIYFRVNKEIPGSDWYEYYEDFVYYYNGKAITTNLVRSISTNHKYLYFAAKFADIGTPKEGDIITIKPNTVATCGGYEIALMNEFKMMFSDGIWSAYVETDVTAPEATGSLWEEFRFDSAYIPTTKDGSVTFAGSDEFNKISTVEDYKDYTMKFSIKKSYDDEDTSPFRFILRGQPVSETEAMTSSLLYGYVLTFEPAKIKDAESGEYTHYGAYIHLWKNGENNSLKDAYRLHYIYDKTENPFFKYDEYYDFEVSVYNITDTCVCITMKVNGALVLRYYDEAGSDPLDPAVNGGKFVIQAVAPATVQGEIVELDTVIAEADECKVGEKVRVSATYPSVIEGAEFNVDSENATVKEGVFKAEKAGTYTVSCTYNGKKLTSKVITVTEAESTDEVTADNAFPVVPVIIITIVVVAAAAGTGIFFVMKKKKKENIQE